MLTQEENERLTQVGPGTPMGELLRRYWQPVATVPDLERESVLATRVLGENLVLYKAKNGSIGLVEQRCPHRGVSLAFGMADAEGIRCPYHGWYFNSEGRCIEQPYDDMEDPDNTFKDKIVIKSYPVQVLGGLVWAYFGPAPAPVLPRFEVFAQEPVKRFIDTTNLPCNWLQCMDNSLDPSHVDWLHAEYLGYLAEREGREPQMRKAKHTKMAFDVFEYGIYKRRVLEGDDESSADWIIGHPMIFPNSNCDPGTFQVRVPIDDTNTMHYLVRTKPVGGGEEPSLEVKDFPWATPEGKIRVDGVFPTDYMAWITQGPVAPRPLEHLGRTDRGIILYRQLLNDSIAKVQRGEDPHGIIRDEAMNQQMIHIRTENDMGGARRAYQTPAAQPLTVPTA
jgi:5,5'-dehydrodivanillate O-demethylase